MRSVSGKSAMNVMVGMMLVLKQIAYVSVFKKRKVQKVTHIFAGSYLSIESEVRPQEVTYSEEESE